MSKINKDTTLYAYWSKKEKDAMYCWPDNSADGHLLHWYFDPSRGSPNEKPSLYKELEARGYDLSTLRFSIKKKVV